MKQRKSFFYSLFGCLLCSFSVFFVNAQNPETKNTNPDDSLKNVDIKNADKLTLLTVDDSTSLQVAVGNVKMIQDSTVFYCDSCVINNRTKIFEAFGHIHIINADTSQIWSDYLQYLFDKKIAYFKKNVRLTDGKGTLTTPDLEYDVETKIGIYRNGGKVVSNKKTVLTSEEGYYYTDLKDVYFKHKVVLDDPAYHLRTDSLLYNTENELAKFIAYTFIKDSSNRTIETTEGFYNLKSGQAEFGNRPIIHDGKLFVTGNYVTNNDSTGEIDIQGKGIMIDTAEGRTVKGNHILVNKKKSSFFATDKPLMILKQNDESDSIYITADTLFSAKISDYFGKKDSLVTDTIKTTKVVTANDADSSNRFFMAFHHVRIFSDSLQAVSDSLFYSFRDSTFRLFTNPVVWSKESQITGDTIYLLTKNKKADRLKVINNSFLINKAEPEVFNQIKSTRMDGYFKDGSIDSVRARGFAECIYFIQDQDSSFTGINQSQSDIIDIYFLNQDLQKVIFRSDVTGTIWPIRQKDPKEMRLQNFKWWEARRPKTKFELMQ